MAETIGSRSSQETQLLDRAKQRLPGGVLGTARYADDVGFVVKHGKGSKIYDVSGREYIDYVMASGPMVLGHAHPAVVAAVRQQLEAGTTYFMVTEPIIELAEEICRAVPCAEQVRFTSTGSEATFFALRVARAVESGNLSVNSHSSVRYWTPFGGMKQSGLGRELGPDALLSFTDVKNVFLAAE